MSADHSEEFKRIVNLLPPVRSSNPIAQVRNYCKLQLGFDVDLRNHVNENGKTTTQVYFGDRFIEEFTHSHPSYALEQACDKAIRRLHDEKDLLNEIIAEYKGF